MLNWPTDLFIVDCEQKYRLIPIWERCRMSAIYHMKRCLYLDRCAASNNDVNRCTAVHRPNIIIKFYEDMRRKCDWFKTCSLTIYKAAIMFKTLSADFLSLTVKTFT